MSEHPAVVKAKHLGRIGLQNGWKGMIDSDIVLDPSDKPTRTTELTATRNDEQILVYWINEHLEHAIYSIFGRSSQLSCAKQVTEKLTGWPDLNQLFKWFPDMNRPNLVEKYRRLPFDWQNDPDEDIIATLVGNQIHWYSHLSTKIHSDVVLPQRKGKKSIEIREVGHRKMFNFIGVHAGFRSVLLDTILRVDA